ncbi:hypothetical protein HXV89_10455 [Bacillus subtilis]|uniref:hypothetical protein n=1 Tax=Bacillus inaquosorum TaxID=483913 RepID=UPI001EDF061C|nr:hypothetical protein [Bacillus inaquosorum]MCG3229781.1 hypothetical protein [Bacillus subtilis]MCY8729480.1 hypothetical protein [Bacillus inaquosorum]
MAQGNPNRRSVNYDIYQIIKKFFKSSSREEIRHDLILPLVIAILIIGILVYCKLDILQILRDLNDVIITVMSILAGFNTASIAIISSSNLINFIDRLEGRDQRRNGEQLLKSLTSYFSYAIMLQLFILIVSIIASLVFKFLDFETIKNSMWYYNSLIIFFIIWFTIVLNSLFITIRNVAILHNFILFIGRR